MIPSSLHPLGTSVTKNLLPAGYRACKYLESSGEQYIDTGIHIQVNHELRLDTPEWVNAHYLGSYEYRDTSNAARASYTTLQVSTLGGYWAGFNSGMQFYSSSTLPIIGEETSIILNRSGVMVNGITAVSQWQGLQTDTCALTLFLFGRQSYEGKELSRVKISRFTCYDDAICCMDLVPALDVTGRPCMFDLVSKRSFYSGSAVEFMYE